MTFIPAALHVVTADSLVVPPFRPPMGGLALCGLEDLCAVVAQPLASVPLARRLRPRVERPAHAHLGHVAGTTPLAPIRHP